MVEPLNLTVESDNLTAFEQSGGESKGTTIIKFNSHSTQLDHTTNKSDRKYNISRKRKAIRKQTKKLLSLFLVIMKMKESRDFFVS